VKKGYTLIEMLVVIGIVMVLAAIILPVLTRGREEGRLTSCASNLRNIYIAWESYSADWNGVTLPGWQGPPSPGHKSMRTWEDLILPGLDVEMPKPFDEDAPLAASSLFCPSSDLRKQQGPHATTAVQNEVYVTNYCYNGNTMAYDNAHFVHVKQIEGHPATTIIMADGAPYKMVGGVPVPCGQGYFLTQDQLDIDDADCQVDYRHSDMANFLFGDGHTKIHHNNEARTFSPLLKK